MEIKQRFVLGTPAPLATPTGTDIAADNISATNVTTTNLAATNISVGATSVVGTVSVKDFGAKGDGVSDDTTAITQAFASVISGGTVLFPPGTYKMTSMVFIQGNNIIVEGSGATIIFSPILPIVPGTNDRCLVVEGGVTGPFNFVAGTGGAIALGATSFLAANASDAATLQPNDWVILTEKDTGQSPVEIYFYDQYQVASVSGTTVNLNHRVRTAFPGTHSTIQFTRISNLTQNVTIRNLTLTSTYSVTTGAAVLGILIGLGARTVVVDNVVINMPTGNAIATYQTADLKIVNSTFNSGNIQSTELATVVDLLVDNNVFDSYNQLPQRPALTIDFGTAFSNFSHNVIRRSANFGFGLFFGVHDCSFVGNTIGWVTGLAGASAVGIGGVGCYNNVVAGNTLLGGDGASSTGISFNNDNGAIPPVLSNANRVASNRIGQFVYATGLEAAPSLTRDTYLQLSTIGTTQPLVKVGQVLQLSDLANNNPFVRFTLTGQEFNISASAGLLQIGDVTNAGQMLQLSSLPGTAVYLFGWAVLRSILAGSRTVNPTDYTPNPIPAQSVATFAISVPGAGPSDEVALAANPGPGSNLVWCGFVSGTGTVTVQVANPTAAAVTPVASTWRAIAVRHN